MTPRETRKTRSERRSRIEVEGLESRNLLSGLGSVGTPDLVVNPPHAKLTPEVMVVHVVPPRPAGLGAKLTPEVMAVDFSTTGGGGKFVADVKKAPPANWVADIKLDFHPPEPVISTGPRLHPPQPCNSLGPASQILIGLHPQKTVVSSPYQTSVWGGIESIGTIKKG